MKETILNIAQKYLRYIRRSGPNNVGGPCPFHKEGLEQRPSFYINLTNGLYFCHSCHARGTLPQFLKHMGASGHVVDTVLEMSREELKDKKPRKVEFYDVTTEHVLNESLLGVFDFCPIPLVEAGYDQKLLKALDIGFDRKQLRITFPIRDLYGTLVGISGRAVTPDAYPRYKVYKSEDILPYAPDDPEVVARYRRYDIKNHYHMWNMHNVYPEAFFGELDTLVVVEGYKACLWCIQNGISNCVAIQGSWLSKQQEALLRRLSATFVLLLDNNKAGRRGSYNTAARLQKYGRTVLVCSYPPEVDEHAQPDDLDAETLLQTLDSAERFNEWRTKPWNSVHRELPPSAST